MNNIICASMVPDSLTDQHLNPYPDLLLLPSLSLSLLLWYLYFFLENKNFKFAI